MANLLQPPERVAVASKTGVLVDECFGRAEVYRIYQRDASGYRLAEFRAGPKPCREGDGHDPGALAGAVESLADCGMVLAGRIGPEAERQLSARGVVALATRIGIEDALARLARR